MKKCKNIECKNPVLKNRTYCSLKCRNVYVNKYLRDYKKCSQTQKEKHKEKYVGNNCLECGIEISYEKRENEKFCSHSCSLAHNNKNKIISEEQKKQISSKLKEFNLKHFKPLRVKKNCKNCSIEFDHAKSINPKFCNIKCKRKYDRKDLNEYQKYRLDARFKFNIFDYPNEFNLKLIETYGFYKAKNKGDNPTGISRDHIYSIRDGFDNNVDTNLISHPANCRLIFQKENAIKHRKSIITLEELKEKIEKWERLRKKEKDYKKELSFSKIN